MEEKKVVCLPCRLRGTQIRTDDLGRGMLVSELDGPNPGSAADVEDTTEFITDGCQVEFVAEADLEHLMRDVEAVEFAL